MRFVVLGAGMMGSALCVPLADAGHHVHLVGTHLDEAIIAALRAGEPHPGLGVRLSEAVVPFPIAQLERALHGADVLALGVSSAGIGWAAQRLREHARRDVPVFMITKGLEWDGQRLSVLPDVVQRSLPDGSPGAAAVAGPCIAGELARRVPSCVVLAGRDSATLERIAGWMRTDYYHVWTSTDVVGSEICAALKNAYAMGVAFGAGIHERRGNAHGSVAMHNYESAIFAQAVYEMRLVIAAMGGDPASAAGLAGAGDLDVTNNGGRTGRFGRLLGLGLSVPEAIERMQGATLECLEILAVMREATRGLQARGELGGLPLLDHLAAVALDGVPVDVPLGAFFGGLS